MFSRISRVPRFWPASRRNRPKQFLTRVSETPLLRTTFERLEGLVVPERTWVVTTAETGKNCQAIEMVGRLAQHLVIQHHRGVRGEYR